METSEFAEPAVRRKGVLHTGWMVLVVVAGVMLLLYLLVWRPVSESMAFFDETKSLRGTVDVVYGHPEWMEDAWSRMSDEPLFLPWLDRVKGVSLYLRSHPSRAWFQQLAKLRGLEELAISCDELDDEHLRLISSIRTLRSLSLFEVQVTNEGMRHIESLQEMEHLTIDANQLTDAGLKHVGTLGNLNELWFFSDRVTGGGFESFKQLEHLKVLNFRGTTLSDEGIVYLSTLPQLTELWIQALHLSRRRAELLGKCSTLRRLVLYDKTEIDSDAMHGIALLSQLETLDLSQIDLRAVDLDPLSRCRSLTALSLGKSGVSDDQIRALATCPLLERLHLRGTAVRGGAFLSPGWKSLAALVGDDAPFDDEGMRGLESLTSLSEVWLERTQISDEGLESLSRVRRLKTASISSPKITSAGIRKLESARPDVSFELKPLP